MLEVRLKLITCLNTLGLNSLFVFILNMLNNTVGFNIAPFHSIPTGSRHYLVVELTF